MSKRRERTDAEDVAVRDGAIKLAASMIDANTRDCLVCYTGPDGNWHMFASNRTWAMGAVHRARLELDEMNPPPQDDD